MTETPDQDTAPEAASKSSGSGFLRFLPIVIIVLAFIGAYAAGLHEWLSFEKLRENREGLTQWVDQNAELAVVAFIALYAGLVAISFPGASILTIVGGFLFGAVWGGVYVVAAATIGATLIFLAARTALREPMRKLVGGFLDRMAAGFQDGAFSYLLVLRLVPLFPFWAVNLVPAFLGVPLGTFILATAIGIIPGSFVYASVGNGLGAVFDEGGTPDLGLIFDIEILGPILGLAALSLVPVLYRRFARKKPAQD